MKPKTKAEFRMERNDAVASGIGAVVLLGLAVWGTVRMIQGTDFSIQPNPLWRGDGMSTPGAFAIVVMSLFAVALLWRAIIKWRIYRNKKV